MAIDTNDRPLATGKPRLPRWQLGRAMTAFAFCVRVLMLALLIPAASAATADCSESGQPIGGHAEVSGAEAIYTLPLAIPRPKQTLIPDVSLSYASRRGDGIAGIGWSLHTEQSSIHRCPAIVDSDGHDGRVHYVDSDRLCLDGKRLILDEGEYGRDRSVYLTEIESGNIVYLRGDINDGDATFAVLQRGFGTSIYSAISTPKGAPAPLSWKRVVLTREDHQTIQWRYEGLPADEALLREVRYGGYWDIDNGPPRAGPYVVRFHYDVRADTSSGLLGGGESRSTRILSRIESGVRNAHDVLLLRANYHLRYRESQSSGRRLLDRISGGIYDDDGQYECRAPTRIEWLDRPVRFDAPAPMSIPWPEPDAPIHWQPGDNAPAISMLLPVSDVDGDGVVGWGFRSALHDCSARTRAADCMH